MTAVPLPQSPAMRVRLIYTQADTQFAGSRFFLGFSGGTATTADLNTLAGDIAAQWNTNIAPQVSNQFSLTEVDILDLTTDTGNSGTWTGTHTGALTGSTIPSQVAVNCEFGIARRYRGGKPRMYWPSGDETTLHDLAHWTSTYVTNMTAAVEAFFTAVQALSVGSLGVLTHVNLSYYKGFTNVTNSSGRTRAAPNYRTAALLDTITSYNVKAECSSQRRRRLATTP